MLQSYVELADGITVDAAAKVRTNVTLAPVRVDYHHRRAIKQVQGFRAPTEKFRKDGMLLPFGASRSGFNVPNPYVG